MDFLVSLGRQAKHKAMQAVGAVEVSVDKEYEEYRSSSEVINRELNEIHSHLAIFVKSTKESMRAYQALVKDFQTVFQHLDDRMIKDKKSDYKYSELKAIDLDSAVKSMTEATQQLEKALSATGNVIVNGCSVTISTVCQGLESEHQEVEKKRMEYDELRYEVRNMLESGHGASMAKDIEQKSQKMDQLQNQYESSKARLDAQYVVVEATASNNLQNAFTVLFDETHKYYSTLQTVLEPLPSRFSNYTKYKTSQLEALQEHHLEKQKILDAKHTNETTTGEPSEKSEKSVEKTTEKPSEKPIETPDQKPVAKQDEKLVEKPIENPVQNIAEKPDEKQNEKPSVQSPTKPQVEPIVRTSPTEVPHESPIPTSPKSLPSTQPTSPVETVTDDVQASSEIEHVTN